MSPSEVLSSLRRFVRASFSIMEQKAEGPLFSHQTQLTWFLCPHQYCYLHSVSIQRPYNHKMLIAPINSQSVCALVCSPGALKVRVKMNCSFILLQKKKRERETLFFPPRTIPFCGLGSSKKAKLPLSLLSLPVRSS